MTFLLGTAPGRAAADEHQEPVIVFSRPSGDYWQLWAKKLANGDEKQITFSPGDKRAPECQASLNRLVYRTANSETFFLNLETLEEKQILNRFGVIMDQKVSPDETKVVFTRMRSDLPDDSDVWTALLEGDDQAKALTDEPGLQYNPAWVSRGNGVIFVSQKGGGKAHNLYHLGLNQKKAEQLTKGAFYDLLPDVSPDGNVVVFSSNRAGNFDIWAMNLTDKILKPLTKSSGLDTSPVFSADGNSILFVSTRSGAKQAWVMDLNGEGQKQVTDGTQPAQEPAWCPRASIVFQKGK